MLILLTLFLLVVGFINLHGYKLLHFMNKINAPFITKKEIHDNNYAWRHTLRDNYKVIRQEYADFRNLQVRFRDIDPMQINYDTGDEKWLVIILKQYGTYTRNIDYFPDTYNLIKDIPGCITAMFSAIEPNKCIPPHVGSYNGVLRYHLALITDPLDYEQCYIIVGKYKYAWRAGEDILFDNMFLHFVQNKTNTIRVVLFLDILREFDNAFIMFLNKTFIKSKKEILHNINHPPIEDIK